MKLQRLVLVSECLKSLPLSSVAFLQQSRTIGFKHGPRQMRKIKKKSWRKWKHLTEESDAVMRRKAQRESLERAQRRSVEPISSAPFHVESSDIMDKEPDNEDLDSECRYNELLKNAAENYDELLEMDYESNMRELFPENSGIDKRQLIFVEPHIHFEGSIPHNIMARLCANVGIDYFGDCFQESVQTHIQSAESELSAFRLPMASVLRMPTWLLPEALQSAATGAVNVNLEMAAVSSLLQRAVCGERYLELLEECAYEIGRTQAKNRVFYTEMRVAVHRLVSGSAVSARRALLAIIGGLSAARRDFGVEIRPLICALRGASPRVLRQCVALCYALRDADKRLPLGVVGLDVCGSGAPQPYSKVRALNEMMQSARALAIGRTNHIGDDGFQLPANDEECEHSMAVVSSAEEWRAKHVKTAIHQLIPSNRVWLPFGYKVPKHILHRLFQRQVHVEVCVSDALQSGRSLQQVADDLHWATLNAMNLSANSDCPTVWNTSLQRELRVLRQMDFLPHDLVQSQMNAMRAAFVDPLQKTSLLHALRRSWKLAKPTALINLDAANFAEHFEDHSFGRDQLLDTANLYGYFEN